MFRTLDGIGKKYTYRLYISELADGGWMYISRVFNLFSGCVVVALPPVQSPSLRAANLLSSWRRGASVLREWVAFPPPLEVTSSYPPP